jgi:hypothetical protein
MYGTQEGNSLFPTHSATLQVSLPDEAQFPSSEGWPDSVKDKLIPLFPNQPSAYYEYLHEED